jgi:hypothetical protein
MSARMLYTVPARTLPSRLQMQNLDEQEVPNPQGRIRRITARGRRMHSAAVYYAVTS